MLRARPLSFVFHGSIKARDSTGASIHFGIHDIVRREACCTVRGSAAAIPFKSFDARHRTVAARHPAQALTHCASLLLHFARR
ncbi:hypothetical protein [Burkholderia latens]|uniref:hypothetical protein n=1 Tax=Burkholderia latens TaxID=488446 RepID=UPI001ABB6F83|nr:hypothetical protein [Burkholderia latens]